MLRWLNIRPYAFDGSLGRELRIAIRDSGLVDGAAVEASDSPTGPSDCMGVSVLTGASVGEGEVTGIISSMGG